MYFVDIHQLMNKLEFFSTQLAMSKRISIDTEINKLALERVTHLLIESLLDIGNMMIDGFVMRDPGSYADIISILVDENVLEKEEEDAYHSLVHLRKSLIQEYDKIDHEVIVSTLNDNHNYYKSFEQKIKIYLADEMGVANTFRE
jgi:uncharacterized protein YutE (UPF0331/DUF86 family)